MSQPNKPKLIRVWDLWIRLFHWSLVLLVIACWWTAESRQMLYHQYCGYALFGLLIFRIYWGFFGTETARFCQFLKPLSQVWAYAQKLTRREAEPVKGHNPLGGYSVIALIVLLLNQVILGLFAIDVDGFDGGPLSYEISFEAGRSFAFWHEVNFNILLGFIALHLAANLYYLLWRKQNLIASMVHGKAALKGQGVQNVNLIRAIPGVAIALLVVWILLNLV